MVGDFQKYKKNSLLIYLSTSTVQYCDHQIILLWSSSFVPFYYSLSSKSRTFLSFTGLSLSLSLCHSSAFTVVVTLPFNSIQFVVIRSVLLILSQNLALSKLSFAALSLSLSLSLLHPSYSILSLFRFVYIVQ